MSLDQSFSEGFSSASSKNQRDMSLPAPIFTGSLQGLVEVLFCMVGHSCGVVRLPLSRTISPIDARIEPIIRNLWDQLVTMTAVLTGTDTNSSPIQQTNNAENDTDSVNDKNKDNQKTSEEVPTPTASQQANDDRFHRLFNFDLCCLTIAVLGKPFSLALSLTPILPP